MYPNTPNTPTTSSVPSTSMSDGEFKTGAVDSIDRAVQGAHGALDRLADSAVPKVRKLSETTDAWASSLRGSVREQPVMAMAVAFTLGLLVSRLRR